MMLNVTNQNKSNKSSIKLILTKNTSKSKSLINNVIDKLNTLSLNDKHTSLQDTLSDHEEEDSASEEDEEDEEEDEKDNNDKIIVSQEIIDTIIYDNKYLNKCKNEKKIPKNQESISYLLKTNGIILSQSQSIKFGILLEHIISDIISKLSTSFINIKQKNTKNIKEKDHLWLNNHTKTIVYAEFKSNIELDTEKSKSTIKKCIDIKNDLIQKYPQHTIIMNLVALRYFDTSHISSVKKKYSEISDHLTGLNQYLQLFGFQYDFFQNETHYISFLSKIATKAFF